MVASDRPVEQTNRDANKRVVVTSPKGKIHIGGLANEGLVSSSKV